MTPRPGDQADRDAAIHERARNVLLDAGAGTGKTSTLVARMVALVAPHADHLPPMRLDRIAAVTFTRRAAGELRLRLRESLLAEIGARGLSDRRLHRLRAALGQLDAAHVGTIHSFADRLLRLQPARALLSPSYTIVEDDDALIASTYDALLHACEAGTLASGLEGTAHHARALEVEQTLRDALRAGLRAESREGPFHTAQGLDAFVGALLRQRDVPPKDPPLRPFDRDAFDRAAQELRQLVRPLTDDSAGTRYLRSIVARLDRLRGEQDPATMYAALRPAIDAMKSATRTETFEGASDAWEVWKAFKDGKNKKVSRLTPLEDDLLAPFQRWLANRLVRTYPVVIDAFEKVKASHQAVDTVDLLLKLRDLLESDPAVRTRYQDRFDHIFVDEFQDTDPLQAEVILFLCEDGAKAARAEDVKLAPGKLTLVGDPKQSIYRFRRADIAMYEAVRSKVAAGPHLAARLTANFRSTAPLIDWFNERFTAVLGAPPTDGSSDFSASTGEVAYQPLSMGRTDGQTVSIHIVPFEPDEPAPSAASYRALEAEVLARYLRWLIERSDFEVLDPITRKRRRVSYGDVAVLAFETPNLPLLFPELDALGVPYAARGGKLFLQDRLHRQFLLGLRAIADKADGVAQAALHRPPFFAIDVSDVVTESAAFGEAREVIADLRARRHSRSPGDTARDLLERTALGRSVALGPNGVQRLDRLRELCFALDDVAARETLDFDGATARLRSWAIEPVPLDPPHPTGREVVQILTVHQAKGLEFPVVVLWDGRAGMGTRPQHGPWHVARDGRAWQITLDRLTWEEPAGAGLRAAETRYCDAERKRLVYVAATRARDLLIVPRAGVPGTKHIAGMLLAGDHDALALEQQTYRRSKVPIWASAIAPPESSLVAARDDGAEGLASTWNEALAISASPTLGPIGVTRATHAEPDADAPRPRRASRFGPVFGDTVHRAMGHVLRSSATPAIAVGRARAATGLDVHVEDAEADVVRCVDALTQAGIIAGQCEAMRLEYPVVGRDDARMIVGYVDLLVARAVGGASELVVIDFKTDAIDPPAGPLGLDVAARFPDYVAQVRTYVRILTDAGLAEGRRVRAGLLFTQRGTLEWIAL